MLQEISPSPVLTKGPAPTPTFILRGHTSQINIVRFSRNGKRLWSGDSDGRAILWSLDTFRPVVSWQAHRDSVLNILEWDGGILTQGRDNKLHNYPHPSLARPPPNATASTSQQEPLYSIDIDAMGYCKCAFFAINPKSDGQSRAINRTEDAEALVAVPSILRDDLIDIYHLPSRQRVFRSVGGGKSGFLTEDKTGTAMALTFVSFDAEDLQLMVGYEDGRVAVFCHQGKLADLERPRSQEGEGWKLKWWQRGHKEPIMSLAVTPDSSFAWSVAADDRVVRWRLAETDGESVGAEEDMPTIGGGSKVQSPHQATTRGEIFRTNHPGRSHISVRGDGKIVAIGGWDGCVRIHSAKTFRPLAVLEYHKDSIYALDFAPVSDGQAAENPKLGTSSGNDRGAREQVEEESSDDESEEEIGGVRANKERKAWLAVGGKDERISLWDIYPLR